jgi:hypothetical protein
MIVIGHQRPRQALGTSARQRLAQVGQEVFFFRIRVEYPAVLQTTTHHMVAATGYV